MKWRLLFEPIPLDSRCDFIDAVDFDNAYWVTCALDALVERGDRSMRYPGLLVTGCICGTLLTHPANGVEATFQGLPPLEGGVGPSSWGISIDGRVAVGSSINANDKRVAVRWIDGKVEQLPSIPGSSISSFAWDVSADGSAIVGNGRFFGGNVGFRWENGIGTSIGTLGGSSTSATGVSHDGSVVIGASGIGNGLWSAVRWESGDLVDIGSLPGATPSFGNRALDVSADGSVIVGFGDASVADAEFEAFRWENDVMTPLGDLPGGEFFSGANAVSADGSVVVGSSKSTDDSEEVEAFRWEDGLMVGLGDLAGGTFKSSALAASEDGSVVVGRGTTSVGNEAFFWDEQNGMRNLRQMLIDDFGLDLSGWVLTRASDITPDGRIITGDGMNPEGSFEAWIVTIPEPNTAMLLLGATATAAGRRRGTVRLSM